MPPDIKKRVKEALPLVRSLRYEQKRAETFVTQAGDMFAKEVGTDAKGFEEFAMRLNTVKTQLDLAGEPLEVAR